MNEQATGQPEIPSTAKLSMYEQMYKYLYDYHFGRITFLELLEKWKEVLQLPSGDNQ